MKKTRTLLLLGLLGLALMMDAISAAEETCDGRCGSFEPNRKCQCDSMCVYYGSCCPNFDSSCPKKVRGDVFAEVEDELPTEETLLDVLVPTEMASVDTTEVPSVSPTQAGTASNTTTAPPTDRDAAACSVRPFDAFLQLKNGSVYAFRGEYFFELDDKAVLPGYPKLIQDVWGMAGPVDAAFTRINCQGKTYIFKGRQYWRFEGDVLDEGFPLDISEGFDGIPDDIDAAFAVPAPSHSGREKAYFFKGEHYHMYEFVNQPSHEQCVQMSRSSPSLLFTRYTDLFCDLTCEDLFSKLFGVTGGSQHLGPHLIRKNWMGITPPVDAAMVGRVFLSPRPSPAPPPPGRGFKRYRGRRPSRRYRGRKSRHAIFDDFFLDLFDFDDMSEEVAPPPLPPKRTPVQYVYLFKKDRYYRVDLRTRHVVVAQPPYPRSIAKFWMGCQQEDAADTSRAEKR
ncbi:vitronectin b [Nerophis lumbriciformis]|uniref:vitronectin b n=1 Tax=Nerophis lumbriciformis TaxID=546530 RepID=UPI002AE055E8|nr:vitronectin b [Nerophis lumbriciformis]